MRKTIVFMLILIISACSAAAESIITQNWAAPELTVSTWFNGVKPDDSAIDNDRQTMMVGCSPNGTEVFTFLRLPLTGDVLADEIEEARLFLKLSHGDTPTKINVGLVMNRWDFDLTPAEASALIDRQSVTPVSVRTEDNGWFSLAVTKHLLSWMSGNAHNYGFVLIGTEPDKLSAFISASSKDAATSPYLAVRVKEAPRPPGYGRFGYTETPFAGAGEDEGGNCLSYALRDTNMILIDDLKADFSTMNSLYKNSGEQGVLKYFAGLVMAYVDEHKTELHILGFRRLESFDADINIEKEYRIALRVGCKVEDEVDLGGKGNFDYHLWAQLNDGRWAQKFPLDFSEIVPCTGPGIPPDKYPWDSALMWYPKTIDYYTSPAIYFAVEKTTDEFSTHKR